MWMGCLLRDTYKFCVVTWAFPLAWLWAGPVLCSRGAIPSWPSASASHTAWRAVVARTGLCSTRVLLSDCIGMTVSLEKITKTKPKLPPSSFLHPSELLQGLWSFWKTQLCQKWGSYDWREMCYTKITPSWHSSSTALGVRWTAVALCHARAAGQRSPWMTSLGIGLVESLKVRKTGCGAAWAQAGA